MIDSENIKKGSKPLIMVVDDILKNLQVIGSALVDSGYDVAVAMSGLQALESAKNVKPDLILLDIMMPQMDGFEVCQRLKEMPETQNIPVIFLTAKNEADDILKGFELGGVDFITKPFQKQEILARIKTHLDLKFAREELEAKANEMAIINYRLRKELVIAGQFFQSLLPEEITNGPLLTSYKYVPTDKLGGDALGYFKIDEHTFIFYLLDVCGHGISSALFSSSVLNILRFQNLPDVDFKDPAHVFGGLNKIFQMNKHHGMYFTIWYGVYDLRTNVLNFASAGHHPALLMNGSEKFEKLSGANFIIGGLQNYNFKTEKKVIPPGSKIYIFSDGVYDAKLKDGSNMTIDDLAGILMNNSTAANELHKLYDYVRSLNNGKSLKDDFTILKVEFN